MRKKMITVRFGMITVHNFDDYGEERLTLEYDGYPIGQSIEDIDEIINDLTKAKKHIERLICKLCLTRKAGWKMMTDIGDFKLCDYCKRMICGETKSQFDCNKHLIKILE